MPTTHFNRTRPTKKLIDRSIDPTCPIYGSDRCQTLVCESSNCGGRVSPQANSVHQQLYCLVIILAESRLNATLGRQRLDCQ